MSAITASWKSGGLTMNFSCERAKNSDGTWAETPAEWAARARAELTAMQEQFPEDKE